jgi:FKBP12-rapamycin complex-associated protein
MCIYTLHTLGDRHPCNLMLDRLTGKIIHIDFGAVAMFSLSLYQRKKSPSCSMRHPLVSTARSCATSPVKHSRTTAGDCFEVAMHREKFPEKIPFRLTRMLVAAMEVSGIEVCVCVCVCVCRCVCMCMCVFARVCLI